VTDLVPIYGDTVKLIRRANGHLVRKIYDGQRRQSVLHAPWWARDAVHRCGGSSGDMSAVAIVLLVRRAHEDPDVRDALCAALDTGDQNFVRQFAIAQARKEP
jgi:hypothetical protein